MTKYAYIENTAVVQVTDGLPTNWRNISNFYTLEGDADTLASLGWYPVVENIPEFDPSTQALHTPVYNFDGTQVIQTQEVINLPATEDPVASFQWAVIRQMRDDKMANFEWRYTRYDREVRLNVTPTDNIEALDTYMQALADITKQENPFNIVWPTFEA
jgi:hypothetical protein